MSEESGIWEIRLGIFATERQAEDVKERIARMLCPDPEHAGPCPIPWSISLVPEQADDYPELAEQARIEGHDQG